MNFITSTELNYVVYRYLTESGFQHTAFNFGYEGRINKSTIDGNTVPPGALITVVQKGLQYIQLEANFNDNDTDADEDFTFIKPFDLLTKDVNQLKQMIKEEKNKKLKQKEIEEKQSDVKNKPVKRKLRKLIIDDDEDDEEEEKVQNVNTGPTPMDIPTFSIPKTRITILKSEVMILKGHTSDVYDCAWNPSGSLLASGSGDSTGRIWTIPRKTNNKYSVLRGPVSSVELKHSKGRTKEIDKDVTTIDWNMDGTLLATGSCDGKARIWNLNGELKSTINNHNGPVYCIKWNKNGDYLLTGGFDETAIVCEKEKLRKQQFKFHSGPILDVDWRNNYSFASSSTDRMIHVCKVGEIRPLKVFSGHKIWSMKEEKHVRDLKNHTKEVFTLKWSPTGTGTINPNKKLLLASASFDSTISQWDVEHGRILQNMNGHRDCVYTLAFSPNGEYLASGSRDKFMHIWSVKDGKIVKSYNSNGSIFAVCWNKEGDRIAACTSNNSVCVLDFRK